jgi:hypothetical protein
MGRTHRYPVNILELFGSAAGGSILGTGFNFLGRLIEPWNKKREAQVEVMLLEARTSAAEKTEAWKAFTASQGNDDKIDIAGFKLETLHPYVRNAIAAMAGVVSVFRTFTRPGLTWGLLGFLAYVWARTSGEAQVAMTQEITFGAFTAMFWWFGARPVAKAGK